MTIISTPVASSAYCRVEIANRKRGKTWFVSHHGSIQVYFSSVWIDKCVGPVPVWDESPPLNSLASVSAGLPAQHRTFSKSLEPHIKQVQHALHPLQAGSVKDEFKKVKSFYSLTSYLVHFFLHWQLMVPQNPIVTIRSLRPQEKLWHNNPSWDWVTSLGFFLSVPQIAEPLNKMLQENHQAPF